MLQKQSVKLLDKKSGMTKMEESDLTILKCISIPKDNDAAKMNISDFLDQRDQDMPGSNYVIEHFNRKD